MRKISIYNMEKQDIDTLAGMVDEQSAQAIAPSLADKSPYKTRFPYRRAEHLFSELSHRDVRRYNGDHRSPEEYILSMSKGMRRNFAEMLKMTYRMPETFSLAAPSLQNNKLFCIAAIKRNPDVFDYLPERFQRDKQVIKTYRDVCVPAMGRESAEMVEGTGCYPAYKSTCRLVGDVGAYEYARPYRLSPKCDKQEFYSVAAYEKSFERALMRRCTDVHKDIPRNYEPTGNTIIYSADVVFLAAAQRTCPEFAFDYLEAERRVFERNKDAIMERAVNNPEYREQIDALIDRLSDVEKTRTEIARRVQENRCEDIAKAIQNPSLKTDKEMLALMKEVSEDMLKKYVDVEKYWEGRGEWIAKEQLEAAKKHSLDSYNCTQLIEMVKDNPSVAATVFKSRDIAFEQGMKEIQQQHAKTMDMVQKKQSAMQAFAYDYSDHAPAPKIERETPTGLDDLAHTPVIGE